MRKLPSYVPMIAWASMAFLYIPLMAVASFSVNKSRFGLDWKGLTLDWYAKLFQNSAILEAGTNTLVLAVVSTAIATVLGTMLAIGLNRFPWPRRANSLFDIVLNMPVVVPEIVFAAALVIAFALLRFVSPMFAPGMLNMIIGHVTFQVAFVALVVRSRLQVISTDIEEAARDLYADNSYLLRRVTLPLLKPGIISGAMIAFTLSLDDFVISFFTAGPTSVTLPLYIYASVRRGVTPEIHALSTLVLLASIVMVVLSNRVSKKSKQ